MAAVLNDFVDFYQSNKNIEGSNLEFEIRFHKNENSRKLLKSDMDNVIKKVLEMGYNSYGDNTSNNYQLKITPNYTNSRGELVERTDVRCEIDGLNYISKFCNDNKLPLNTVFMKKQKVSMNKIYNPYKNFDLNMKYSIVNEIILRDDAEEVSQILNSWTTSDKYYRLVNRSSFMKPGSPVRIDISVVKSSPTIRKDKQKVRVKSKDLITGDIFNKQIEYEIEIEIIKELTNIPNEILIKELKSAIKCVLSGIQQTNFPIGNKENSDVLEDYKRIFNIDLYPKSATEEQRKKKRYLRSYHFIGPSSITLQPINLVSNQELLTPSILDKYCVTEKADGLRKLLYISRIGKMYLIDSNCRVQYVGAKIRDSNYFASVFDGEHVLYDKNNNFINMYLIFDVYISGGKEFRIKPFLNNANAEPEDYRYNNMVDFANNIGRTIDYDSPSYNYNIRIKPKKFYSVDKELNEDITIFDACNKVLTKTFIYPTDGLIFTPINMPVGLNDIRKIRDDFKPANKRERWDYSFKWKPPEFNTIDFLVEVEKENDKEKIKYNYNGVTTDISNQEAYKTLFLKVGFNISKNYVHNPFRVIRDDLIDDVSKKFDYRPARFYPTKPFDPEAYKCNIMCLNSNNDYVLKTEEGDTIVDDTIVEFKYVKENKPEWRWVPLRVRHDKTHEYKTVRGNYGNNYETANNNWSSIHNPITEQMLMDGKGINQHKDGDIYYQRVNKDRKGGFDSTKKLREFHNHIKHEIIRIATHLTKQVTDKCILIDYAVGMGGDMYKWINNKIDFVYGIDISHDNLFNVPNGAYVRYIKDVKDKYKEGCVTKVLYLNANSGKDLMDENNFDNNMFMYQKAILGMGPKDKKTIGKGIEKMYGVARELFDISSIQFALHYMFNDVVTLHTFIKNVYSFTKIGGYFIGTCFDGKKVFDFIHNQHNDTEEEIIINDDNGNKMTSIQKKYEFKGSSIPDDDTCVGMEICIFQESINNYITEYLVNFDYFTKVLDDYGFVPCVDCTTITSTKIGSVMNDGLEPVGSFKNYFDLYSQHKKSMNEMTDQERTVSFMNNYFMYKKVRNVNIDEVYRIHTEKYTRVGAEESAVSEVDFTPVGV